VYWEIFGKVQVITGSWKKKFGWAVTVGGKLLFGEM